ncbi:GNAT family N-acetyltransferase [Arthrobacter terrae]|uniref:GNAT family N-acetyltransferase n=1 Tax=Arthrobacter terrae TaxID=2935737 RepID=UPI0035E45EA2
MLVAEEKGLIVGYAWSNPLLEAGPAVDLDLIAVSPEMRRRGVSQVLIASSVEAYRRAGFKIAVAAVSELSFKAFEKAGWDYAPVGHEIRWEWPGASEAWFGPDMLSRHHDRVAFLRLTSDAPAIHVQPKVQTGAIAK